MADAVAGLDQAFGFEAGEHTSDRSSADRELGGQLLLGQAAARRIFEQADAVPDDAVEALEALARGRRRARPARRSNGVHVASSTAFRNCRVRSFSGAPKILSGEPWSQMRPPWKKQ